MDKKKTIQNKRNFFISIFTVLGCLIALSLILMPGNALARNIKVGIIDCYSGPAALFGKDALNGFKLALKEINKEGVLGKKIEFTTRDTKFKVDLALNFAKELVLREGVDILVGTINSGAALAVSEAVAKREKVPFIAWISKSENITGKKGHSFPPFVYDAFYDEVQLGEASCLFHVNVKHRLVRVLCSRFVGG